MELILTIEDDYNMPSALDTCKLGIIHQTSAPEQIKKVDTRNSSQCRGTFQTRQTRLQITHPGLDSLHV